MSLTNEERQALVQRELEKAHAQRNRPLCAMSIGANLRNNSHPRNSFPVIFGVSGFFRIFAVGN